MDGLLWSDISRYALNTLTVPNERAKEDMLLAITYPDVFVGAGQFSKTIKATRKSDHCNERARRDSESTVIPENCYISRLLHRHETGKCRGRGQGFQPATPREG